MKSAGKRRCAHRRNNTHRCPIHGENCKWIVSLETPGFPGAEGATGISEFMFESLRQKDRGMLFFAFFFCVESQMGSFFVSWKMLCIFSHICFTGKYSVFSFLIFCIMKKCSAFFLPMFPIMRKILHFLFQYVLSCGRLCIFSSHVSYHREESVFSFSMIQKYHRKSPWSMFENCFRPDFFRTAAISMKKEKSYVELNQSTLNYH